jgi:hypothetical protein
VKLGTQPVDTPPFLLWAIESTCPVRGLQNGSDPERTERQLRAARAVSDARREGRVIDDLCVEPPFGFRVEEALSIYGGSIVVEQACRGCPANALLHDDCGTFAGCFGIVPLPDERLIHAAVEPAIRQVATVEYDRLFRRTDPIWFGLWMNSPLDLERVRSLLAIMKSAAVPEPMAAAFRQFQSGLQSAVVSKQSVHVALYPRGRVEGTWWRRIPHCPECKAAWDDLRSRECAVCGFHGSPAPEKKRHARGRRPYRPLEQIVGTEQAKALLARYQNAAARPQS